MRVYGFNRQGNRGYTRLVQRYNIHTLATDRTGEGNALCATIEIVCLEDGRRGKGDAVAWVPVIWKVMVWEADGYTVFMATAASDGVTVKGPGGGSSARVGGEE